MAIDRTRRFAEALQQLEGGGQLDSFVELFADTVELHRPETGQQLDGSQGARAFWSQYLAMFGEIHSEFGRVVDAEVGVLEWTSTGRLATGSPISYTGVSILDFDAADKITRFATYFDTQAFDR